MAGERPGGGSWLPRSVRLRSSGSTTRLELYVLPVYRGDQCFASSPCSPPVFGRELVPAPRVGSIPVVSFRLLGGAKMMGFVGTPLDRDLRSVVWVKLPRASVSKRWVISVRADGRVYPDLVDPPVTTVPDESAPNVAAGLSPAGARRASGAAAWPWLAFIALVGGCLVLRATRSGRRLLGRA